ncbi:MAG TPA: ATP-binding protein [Flavisolibacter sp.]|nr:ATP-binding protein [Flavisolibacter sp.]
MLGNEEIFKLNKLNNNTQWVEISLKDNGIGFRQEFALKIFGTFERLHSRQVYEGTGLGLSLCKNIVERHHGSITAYGEEDIGADFRILLPKMKINE